VLLSWVRRPQARRICLEFVLGPRPSGSPLLPRARPRSGLADALIAPRAREVVQFTEETNLPNLPALGLVGAARLLRALETDAAAVARVAALAVLAALGERAQPLAAVEGAVAVRHAGRGGGPAEEDQEDGQQEVDEGAHRAEVW